MDASGAGTGPHSDATGWPSSMAAVLHLWVLIGWLVWATLSVVVFREWDAATEWRVI